MSGPASVWLLFSFLRSHTTTDVNLWIAVCTGALTFVASSYGMFRTFQQRRLDAEKRLFDAATVAVRRVEAAYVRPILRNRSLMVINELIQHPHASSDPLIFRMNLFCALQHRVCLTAVEKEIAHQTAVDNLVEQLRGMPNPPLRVGKDPQQHQARLGGLVEIAYNMRPRPSGDMIQQLGGFCCSTMPQNQLDVSVGDNARNQNAFFCKVNRLL